MLKNIYIRLKIIWTPFHHFTICLVTTCLLAWLYVDICMSCTLSPENDCITWACRYVLLNDRGPLSRNTCNSDDIKTLHKPPLLVNSSRICSQFSHKVLTTGQFCSLAKMDDRRHLNLTVYCAFDVLLFF